MSEPHEDDYSRHPLEMPTRQERDQDARQEALRKGTMVRVKWGQDAGQPWITWSLLAAIVLIFAPALLRPRLYRDMMEAGALYWPAVVQQGEWWRLITHMFLHVDASHIAMNALSLFYLGQTRERNDGRLRYVLLYVLAGLGGGVVQLLTASHDSGAVGASGAIFGLAGAELVFLWRHQRYMGAAGRSAWMQLLVLIVLQIMIGFAASEVIGNGAHVGGLLIGLAWAWIYGPNYVVQPQTAQRDADGIGVVRATDTLPFSRGRLWGVLVLGGAILAGCVLLKLMA